MTPTSQPAMAEALRLTRTGNLMDATRLIQGALAGGPRPIEPVMALPDPVTDLTPHV